MGVLGYVMPLLFSFDATHEGDSVAPSAEASAVAALANNGGSAEADASRDTGPAFLGLGTERSNMQVGPQAPCHTILQFSPCSLPQIPAMTCKAVRTVNTEHFLQPCGAWV